MSKKKKRGHGWTSVCRKRCKWEPFTRNPKKTLVGVSNIPTAGLGLFLLESVKKGERIAIYSGEVLNKEQIMNSDSKYLLKISSNVFLDAQDVYHCHGRYINCGRNSRLTINARFSASRKYNYDSASNTNWVSIFATSDIKASETEAVEILVDYGEDYWKGFDTSTLEHKLIAPISNIMYRL